MSVRVFAQDLAFTGSESATTGLIRIDATASALELLDDDRVDNLTTLSVVVHVPFTASWNSIQDTLTEEIISEIESNTGRTLGPHDVMLVRYDRG